ncbi:zinc ribbon domain-containing protein [Malonomonas rubra]|uniref:zinc ribbon domain-containing protein n=1 Tax=Malonomonas rubra TaxID=57040 RepID=UPI0026EEE057|nr:C4-type zinc ribbon domain-containing protein [Malonomonas rubra]
MHEQMNLLKELQEIDQEISTIEKSQQGYRQELDSFGVESARVQAMLDELSAELAVLQKDEAQLQQDLLRERDNIARVEGRLPEIQTQKEYVAVLKEIDMAKKANKDLDEQLLAKLQEISSLEEDLQEKEAELAGINEKAEARTAEINELLAESDTALEKRKETRESVTKDLPTALLRKYQTLFKRRGGLALALASNGACLGCNMQLPPQQFNSLLRETEMQTCPHCNRLLYVEQG